ncbi:DUF6934 family protein [Chitinophaga sp. ARDCPP14]|uniref:DUF6934 family protein n=1 Tax=Chitinophaga sp. ARDCPP14 TaxID=3391139 RepID=UPI003F5208FB
MIRINFEDTFEPIEVATDLTDIKFYSRLKNGKLILLKIEIRPLTDPLLPNVFNLAFGPLNEEGKINDEIKVNHSNIGKMFSTVLLFALSFLRKNNSSTIGVDGSNDIRAYLYHRMFQTNKKYLCDVIITIGVDWYVRLLRNNTVEKDNLGFPFFKPKPEQFDYQRSTKDLYRYYMFHLNN